MEGHEESGSMIRRWFFTVGVWIARRLGTLSLGERIKEAHSLPLDRGRRSHSGGYIETDYTDHPSKTKGQTLANDEKAAVVGVCDAQVVRDEMMDE